MSKLVGHQAIKRRGGDKPRNIEIHGQFRFARGCLRGTPRRPHGAYPGSTSKGERKGRVEHQTCREQSVVKLKANSW